MSQDEILDIQFGIWLTNLRYKREWNLLQFSQASNISMSRIYDLERGRGKSLTEGEASRIALAFQIPLEAVLSQLMGEIH